MYTAVFIGGEYDLTKRMLERRECEIVFLSNRGEPQSIRKTEVATPLCIDELVYRLQSITYDGVLIYEYSFTKGHPRIDV